jgi:hypothetical protein
MTHTRNRLITLAALVAALAIAPAACSHIPGLGPSAVPSDTVTYQVIGTPGTGNALITYATPTSVVQVTFNINQPFQTGAIAGYGQFVDQKPSITVTAFGCATAQVLVNAKVEAEKTGCGQPVTLSAVK